jgi:beta-glucosidase
VVAAGAQEQAAAILEAWYPGEEGGNAIARVLAGDINPSGRLPVTFYRSVNQLPPFDDYAMAGHTYRYFTADPLYPFGFGLSYSTFRYSHLSVSRQRASVLVTNTSKRDGDEVVQLFISTRGSLPALAGFERIHLAAGAHMMVEFQLDSGHGAVFIRGTGAPSAGL